MVSEKEKIIENIKIAEKKKLEEQDRYREELELNTKTEATPEQIQTLRDIGYDGLLAYMADEHYPPHSKDWKQWLELNWDEIPRRRQLDKIEDKDIGASIYFYNELTEHTERIKALARFYSLAKADCRAFCGIFHYWSEMAMMKEMREQADAAGIPTEHLSQFIAANEGVARIMFDHLTSGKDMTPSKECKEAIQMFFAALERQKNNQPIDYTENGVEFSA